MGVRHLGGASSPARAMASPTATSTTLPKQYHSAGGGGRFIVTPPRRGRGRGGRGRGASSRRCSAAWGGMGIGGGGGGVCSLSSSSSVVRRRAARGCETRGVGYESWTVPRRVSASTAFLVVVVVVLVGAMQVRAVEDDREGRARGGWHRRDRREWNGRCCASTY